MLLAVAGAAAIFVVLTWGRWGSDPTLAELLLRFIGCRGGGECEKGEGGEKEQAGQPGESPLETAE